MLVILLRAAHGGWNRLVSFFRLLVPRAFGLRTGKGLRVGSGIEWPLGNLRNIKLGDHVSLGKWGWFYIPLDNRCARIEVGDRTAIGSQFVVSCNQSVRVGCDCLIGYRVSLLDFAHVVGWEIKPVVSGTTEGEPIVIGNACFLGCNCVIMSGVSLGDYCIVGANSVVTKSFPPGSVVAGTPARLLRTFRQTPESQSQPDEQH